MEHLSTQPLGYLFIPQTAQAPSPLPASLLPQNIAGNGFVA